MKVGIRWNATKDDAALIKRIVRRAVADQLCNSAIMLSMDITAVHLNSTPLDLAALANGDQIDFTHDVIGILQNVDRRTGRLCNCFSPRFTKRVVR